MQRQPKEYEHSYTVWKQAKKAYRLHAGDTEPDHKPFGLSDWEAAQIRKRVDKEMERTA